MTRLFDKVNPEFDGPQGHNENTYAYYCRSNRSEIQNAILQMENWFLAYPDNEKVDLRNTIKNNFDAGFFEWDIT